MEIAESDFSYETVSRAVFALRRNWNLQIRKINGGTEVYLPESRELSVDQVNSLQLELADQNLRLKIRQETELQRNLILAYTFSQLENVENGD